MVLQVEPERVCRGCAQLRGREGAETGFMQVQRRAKFVELKNGYPGQPGTVALGHLHYPEINGILH